MPVIYVTACEEQKRIQKVKGSAKEELFVKVPPRTAFNNDVKKADEEAELSGDIL